jgi:hypothetical protein
VWLANWFAGVPRLDTGNYEANKEIRDGPLCVHTGGAGSGNQGEFLVLGL